MKAVFYRGIVLVAVMSLPSFAFSDTLILKDGTRVTGYYEGGTARVVRFQNDSGIREYDLLSVAEIQFGGDVLTTKTVETHQEAPRLLSREETARPVTSDTAANTVFTAQQSRFILGRVWK